MALNIKNAEAERLVRRLASLTGESVTQAVTVAVRERLDQLEHGGSGAFEERVARITAISRDAAPRWVEPYRSADHGQLLYDEQGLPR
ncbi:MAG TPA: type II toxin-antitoxin system VapB family antitoxin [Acidimicrobiales bacterium]|nr:type II toxin-antitoxin system VapB family antitoxin [Acidimicrobiales bacterium]